MFYSFSSTYLFREDINILVPPYVLPINNLLFSLLTVIFPIIYRTLVIKEYLTLKSSMIFRKWCMNFGFEDIWVLATSNTDNLLFYSFDYTLLFYIQGIPVQSYIEIVRIFEITDQISGNRKDHLCMSLLIYNFCISR